LARELGIEDAVQFIGPVSYLESLDRMMAADQLVLIDAEFDDTNIFFPSKLVDYFGSGKPIIAITPPSGATARLLREAGAGESVSPRDPDAIAAYLEERLAAPVRYHRPMAYDAGEVGQTLLARLAAMTRTSRHAN
ncbi:MAG: hypothetical protein QOE68_4335, partial [Thermoanaerobaculia bacterium]|nr:hypothetical protein [Thermoanaerobaculia bacterium]